MKKYEKKPKEIVNLDNKLKFHLKHINASWYI